MQAGGDKDDKSRDILWRIVLVAWKDRGYRVQELEARVVCPWHANMYAKIKYPECSESTLASGSFPLLSCNAWRATTTLGIQFNGALHKTSRGYRRRKLASVEWIFEKLIRRSVHDAQMRINTQNSSRAGAWSTTLRSRKRATSPSSQRSVGRALFIPTPQTPTLPLSLFHSLAMSGKLNLAPVSRESKLEKLFDWELFAPRRIVLVRANVHFWSLQIIRAVSRQFLYISSNYQKMSKALFGKRFETIFGEFGLLAYTPFRTRVQSKCSIIINEFP